MPKLDWPELLKLLGILAALAAGLTSEGKGRAQVVTQDVYQAIYQIDQRLDALESK